MRNLKHIELLTQRGTACGTTSLAMIIRFLVPDSGVTPDGIDREIRRLPAMFSAPSDLIAYARRKGLQAEEYNNNSIEQMEDLVNQGIPVMALLDLTPDNALDFSQWHWVVVVAVESVNGDKTVLINNPWGHREEWGQDKFLSEWAHLRLLGLVFGYSTYLIAVGTRDDRLPPRRAAGVAAANAVTKGLADVLNGFAKVRWHGSFGGLGQMLGGIFILLYGATRLIGYNVGLWLRLA